MPEFHNFASWLAVHNKRSRRRLIRLHPSGLIYDGDRETYSPDEKREIVLNLRREWAWNAWCSRSRGRVPGFGGIVSPELEDTLREILSDGERDLAHQCYVLLLMQMLADGDPLPTLSDLLEEMVRDATWYPSVRCAALEVLTGYSEQGRIGSASLATMVRDIDGGSIDDPDDALLGTLLKSLYPRVLSMAEVRAHLREPKFKASMGEYSKFWTDHVLRESTPETARRTPGRNRREFRRLPDVHDRQGRYLYANGAATGRGIGAGSEGHQGGASPPLGCTTGLACSRTAGSKSSTERSPS